MLIESGIGDNLRQDKTMLSVKLTKAEVEKMFVVLYFTQIMAVRYSGIYYFFSLRF